MTCSKRPARPLGLTDWLTRLHEQFRHGTLNRLPEVFPTGTEVVFQHHIDALVAGFPGDQFHGDAGSYEAVNGLGA